MPASFRFALALLLVPISAEASDLDRLQGTWTAEAGPAGDVTITLAIDGDRFEQVVEPSPGASFTFRGRLRSDAPGQLDWFEVIGPDADPMPDTASLYQFDGETLTICSAAPGDARPEALAAGRGRFPSLRTYRPVVETVEEETTGDLLAMQGDWSGNVGPNGAAKASLSIRGSLARFVIVGPNGQEVFASSGRVRLDESATPRAMDWLPEAEGSVPVLSIYELSGPSLRLCLGLGRGAVPRPEAFSEDFRTITLTRDDPPTEDDDESDPGT